MGLIVPKLTQDRANELLRLDPETGVLYWRVTYSAHAQAGKAAGCLHKASGYWIVCIDKKHYRAHLVIWLMLYGEWRPREIDHKDRNRSNNRPTNLRLASESQQRSNAKLRSDNALGLRGVSFHKKLGLYAAEVRHRDHRFVKYFHSAEEAAVAAQAERLRVFGQFAPLSDQQGI